MRKALVLLLGLCLLAITADPLSARDVDRSTVKPYKAWTQSEFPEIPQIESLDPGLRGMYTAALADTYKIVWFDFEQLVWQDWTKWDNTLAPDTFFHVDDYAGLGGGDYGGLYPLEGTKSAWCGTRAEDPALDLYFCSWASPPGYGNNWLQKLTSDPIPVTGTVSFSYKAHNDTEPGWDYCYVEYDRGNNSWQQLARYDGRYDTIGVHSFPIATAKTKIRFRLVADGAASDEDALYNSDGALHVDSLILGDETGIRDYENFESAAVGDGKADGDLNTYYWRAGVTEAYGVYSGLATSLMEKDPCSNNFGTMMMFFSGSTVASSSYPGLFDTPFCRGAGQTSEPCQHDFVISPIIDMRKYSTNNDEVQDADIPPAVSATLGGTVLRFAVYRDIPLVNLVFYRWSVRDIVNGCPGQWLDRNLVYYGGDMDWIYQLNDISDLTSADSIQIVMACEDMCDAWYGEYGNCAEHTPSPYIDNVRIERYSTLGPQWNYRTLDWFQDNFPIDEFDLDSYVRADNGNDRAPEGSTTIYPGDSIVATCTAPLAGGLATDGSGAAIYMHVYPHFIGPVSMHKPEKIVGSILEGNWGWYHSDDGTWTTIQGDSCRDPNGVAIVTGGRFCFDLNDTLFTRGYKIDYYFTAEDADGHTSMIPKPTNFEPDPPYYHFTCLPTGKSDILYVDDFHSRGSIEGITHQYWAPAFEAVIPVTSTDSLPDVFDVNAPSSGLSNSPATRTYPNHLVQFYNKIIWDCGNLDEVTIGDGVDSRSDKGNDCKLLVDWMLQSENDIGLWVLGDGVAFDISQFQGPDGPLFMTSYCGINGLVNNGDSYFELTGGRVAGGVITPTVKGTPEGIFNHSGIPDSCYAFGGCFIINSFDVLEKTQPAKYALEYPDYGGNKYYAAVQNELDMGGGRTVRTMWWGFSLMLVRDIALSSPIIRNHMVDDVMQWFNHITNTDITPTEVPKAYKLAQNFPNPFNPSTMIKFDVREKGNVTLKIYNVAGQLVKIMVNGVKDAGSYSVTWDGTNDRGSQVASGVFFYKMEAKNFSMTRKMVLLR